MKVLVFAGEDGIAKVHFPAAGVSLQVAERRLRQTRVDPDAPIHVMDLSEIPTDEHYRAARVLKGDKIEWDMERARALHRHRIRFDRDRLWAQADADVTKAIATGGDATAAEAKRQALRDAPADPRIDAAKTLDELKAVWPLSE